MEASGEQHVKDAGGQNNDLCLWKDPHFISYRGWSLLTVAQESSLTVCSHFKTEMNVLLLSAVQNVSVVDDNTDLAKLVCIPWWSFLMNADTCMWVLSWTLLIACMCVIVLSSETNSVFSVFLLLSHGDWHWGNALVQRYELLQLPRLEAAAV